MIVRPATTPNYRELADGEFERRVAERWRRYADWDLCAYDCRVDRTAGETGA
jgi:putative pyruvate formate lyase activating enzyme